MLLSFVKAKMMKGLDKTHIDVATAEGGEIGDSLLESHSRRQKTVTIAKKKEKHGHTLETNTILVSKLTLLTQYSEDGGRELCVVCSFKFQGF